MFETPEDYYRRFSEMRETLRSFEAEDRFLMTRLGRGPHLLDRSKSAPYTLDREDSLEEALHNWGGLGVLSDWASRVSWKITDPSALRDLNRAINRLHIERVETALGLRLPPPVRAFFELNTTLRFKWSIGPNRWNDSDHTVGGMLDIDLYYLIDRRRWRMASDSFDDRRYNAHGVDAPASEVLVPFDFYSHDPGMNVECAAFLLPSFDVIVTGDDCADINSSSLLTFSDYMDLMFRTYCSPRARDALISSRHTGRARDVFPELFTRTFSLTEESVVALPAHELTNIFRGTPATDPAPGAPSPGRAEPPPALPDDFTFVGKNVAVTGKLSRPRKEVEAQLTAAGAKVGSFTAKTRILIVGGDPRKLVPDVEAKVDEARSRWQIVLTETQMERVLARTAAPVASTPAASAPSPVTATASVAAGAFSGKTVVVTGTLSRRRSDIEAELIQAGAKVAGSVTRKVDFLIAGDKAGSKIDKARSLGVTVLDEAAMREALGQS